MRVLVTRAAEDAERTARRLLRLGATPVIRPVTRIIATGAPLPDMTPEALAATSAHALALAGPTPEAWRRLPLFVVGARTAATAAKAGLANVRPPARDAAALARLMIAALPAAARVLFLAGRPRKTDLERSLTAAGIDVTVHESYRAVAAGPIADPGRVDAALHYSRASAERFCAALTPDLRAALAGVRHCCLSADVAAGLADLGPASVAVAPEPRETALFALLTVGD